MRTVPFWFTHLYYVCYERLDNNEGPENTHIMEKSLAVLLTVYLNVCHRPVHFPFF